MSEYDRIAIAEHEVRYMLSHPFFGVGMDNLGRAEGTISRIANERLAEGLSVEWNRTPQYRFSGESRTRTPGLVDMARFSSWLHRALNNPPTDPSRVGASGAGAALPPRGRPFVTGLPRGLRNSIVLLESCSPPAYLNFSFLAGAEVLTRQELARDPEPTRAQTPAARGKSR